MPVWVITGKLGSGKNLAAVGKIREYLTAGRRVATNINLCLLTLAGGDESKAWAWARLVVRLPDFPTESDLHALGEVENDCDEERNGALVLDECGVLLNARDWGGTDRKGIIDWLLHSRKLGWDVYPIVQDLELLDKQLRRALAEFTVYGKRMDRMAVPIAGTIIRVLTFGLVKLKLPRIHQFIVKYGTGADAPYSDTWWFRGNDIFGAYPTKQLFTRFYEHGSYSPIPNAAPFKPTGYMPPLPATSPAPQKRPARPLPKPKLPEVEAVMRLPADERIRALSRAVAA